MSVAKSVATSALPSEFIQTLHEVGAASPRLADFSVARRGQLVSRRVFADMVRFADFAVAVLAGLIIAALYVDEGVATHALGYTGAVVGTAIVLVAVFESLQLYQVTKFSSLLSLLPRLLFGWAVAFSGLVAAVFFFKASGEFSRFWLAAWFVAGACAIIAERFAVAKLTRHWIESGRLYRRAVIFGGGEVSADVIGMLEADGEADLRICGVFDERSMTRAAADRHGYPMLGAVDSLIAFARATRVDLIIVALPLSAEKRIAEIVDELSQLPVEIKIPARLSELRFVPRTYTRIGSVAMLDLVDKPLEAWGGIAKWWFDKVVATVALILLAPVMAVVAIAVKLDSRGPVFFRQKRYGFNNEFVEVFKFRSMYTDMCDAAAAKLVTKEDPRVTPVGRFIRKTSIDELPQLFNVLLGDLSLVGPRPHALSAKAGSDLYDEVVKSYFKRHKVKPGITGWAQINGWRGETDTHEKIQKRVEHDLYYIENWSIFLDLYILVKTPFALLKSENAY
ncbi:MAG: undecaprenyl-phosphate glucose phosphotransferase [Alphaproteobacteria bacterium BRH_c36]|nr:MAG: undecaprenyl-phosphate glucose phosphotransferase [Alphaproteobacteria bacterium BRH_c36]